MTGEDEMAVEPPTLNERLEWTYEELLKLRVSMLHLAKQVSGPTGQIEEWHRQLGDMLDGVERMRVAQLAEGIDPEIRRQVKQACDELAREFPEGEPGAHEKVTPERRVCVQGHGLHHLCEDDPRRADDAKPAGTITWDEHERAWRVYDRKYGPGQSAERIVERGGFGYEELVEFLGHESETWVARAQK